MIALHSDGTVAGTHAAAEARAINGEEYLWSSPPSMTGVTVTERSALQLPTLLAVFNVLSTDCAVLPLNVYRRREDGGRDQAPDHPIERLLTVTPDDETTPIRWRQAWMTHALSHGNGYCEIQRKGRGTPVGLHLLDPELTRPRRVNGKLWYEIETGRLMAKENILHIAGLGYDGLTGYNMVKLLAQSIGLGMAAETSAATFFSNGAEPGGVIETPRALKSEDARNNLANSWNQKHQGVYNKHRTAVLEEGAKWVQTSTDPEKSQLVETRRFQVVDTSRPWRVPPHKLGDFSEAHLANIEASNLDYLMTALICWLEVVEQELNLKLFTERERAAGYYAEHNVNALLRGNQQGRGEFYKILRDLGVFSPNDICKRENLNPLGPDGDVRLVPLNMVPIDQIGDVAAAEQAPAAAKPAKTATETTPSAPVEPPPGNGVDAPLTGDQIFSIQRVLSDVVAGDLPSASAKALLKASLPSLDEGEIDAMLTPIEGFRPSGPKTT